MRGRCEPGDQGRQHRLTATPARTPYRSPATPTRADQHWSALVRVDHWQPHPPPCAASDPQQVDFSLESQHVDCFAVEQHAEPAGAADAAGAAGASVVDSRVIVGVLSKVVLSPHPDEVDAVGTQRSST